VILISTSWSPNFFGVNSNSFKAVGSSLENDPYPLNFSGTDMTISGAVDDGD
jgi:hypothetical protein